MSHQLGRIESEIVLNWIWERRETLVLQYINRRFSVMIDAIDSPTLTLRRVDPTQETLCVGRIAQLFFRFQDSDMIITTRVQRDRKEKIALIIETSAYRNISREFERIYNGTSILVRVIDAHSDATHYPATTAHVSSAVEEDYVQDVPHRIQPLIRTLFTEARARDMHAKVIMFRTHAPERAAERVCAHLGRVVVIPQPTASVEGVVISSAEEIATAMRQLHIPLPGDTLSVKEHIPEIPPTPIQILAPIIHSYYCVGYLLFGMTFSETADYTPYLSLAEKYRHAISYVLRESDYFASVPTITNMPQRFRVIDISASGLRFRYKNEQPLYNTGDVMPMLIRINSADGDREYLINADVVFVSARGSLHYASVKFTHPSAAFSAHIREHLYGENFHDTTVGR